MTKASLQYALDRVIVASPQQWLLRAGASLAATAAMGISAALEGWSTAAFVVVVGLAVLTSLWPDSHAPLLVDVLVILSLVVAIDDPASPWLPAAAACLVVHHTTITAAASIPLGGELPASVLLRWIRHALAVIVATGALWLAVVAMERRQLPGSAELTALALIVAGGLALAVKHRSVDASGSVPR